MGLMICAIIFVEIIRCLLFVWNLQWNATHLDSTFALQTTLSGLNTSFQASTPNNHSPTLLSYTSTHSTTLLTMRPSIVHIHPSFDAKQVYLQSVHPTLPIITS